jgi:hypothetical protein
MNINAAITLALAIIGVLLGVFNAWRNWINDRVRIRIDFDPSVRLADETLFVAEVRNLSSFPVTINGIGFWRGWRKEVVAIRMPKIVVNFRQLAALPIRLEARTSVSVSASWAEYPEGFDDKRALYITTACGQFIKGGRWFFAQRGHEAAAAAQNAPGVD